MFDFIETWLFKIILNLPVLAVFVGVFAGVFYYPYSSVSDYVIFGDQEDFNDDVVFILSCNGEKVKDKYHEVTMEYYNVCFKKMTEPVTYKNARSAFSDPDLVVPCFKD